MRNGTRIIGGSPRHSGPGRTHAERPGAPIRYWGNGLVLLTLLASLTGCAAPPPVVKTEWVVAPAPVAVLAPTPIPDYTGASNGDLEDYAHELISRLRECSADKRAALAVWPVSPPQTAQEPR